MAAPLGRVAARGAARSRVAPPRGARHPTPDPAVGETSDRARPGRRRSHQRAPLRSTQRGLHSHERTPSGPSANSASVPGQASARPRGPPRRRRVWGVRRMGRVHVKPTFAPNRRGGGTSTSLRRPPKARPTAGPCHRRPRGATAPRPGLCLPLRPASQEPVLAPPLPPRNQRPIAWSHPRVRRPAQPLSQTPTPFKRTTRDNRRSPRRTAGGSESRECQNPRRWVLKRREVCP